MTDFETIPQMRKFLKAYNDKRAYATIEDVAAALDISSKTVVNRAAIHRKHFSSFPAFTPGIIQREGTPAVKTAPEAKPAPNPREHADVRARRLHDEITTLLQRSRYPVTNPEVVQVDSYVRDTYKRAAGFEVIESTPKTWLNGKLTVAPVLDARNRKFLFTGAQNDAIVHGDFWRNLKTYAKEIDAELIVGPSTYETQWWSESNPTARSYAKELTEHLCFGAMEIGDSFVFCGEVNILATAQRPLGGLETYSGNRWAVFPHSHLQLRSIPSTDPDRQSHQVMTSGFCTIPKFIPRKAGNVSIFHHIIGATIVEFDADGDIFCRQINADEDGSFYDLDAFVKSGRVTRNNAVKGIVFGDIHFAKLDPVNAFAAFGLGFGKPAPNSMLGALRPETIFLHDIHDQRWGNHHRVNDGHENFLISAIGANSIYDEVYGVGTFLTELAAYNTNIVVVESNHDLALNRYIKEGRYRNDGVNLRFGLQLESAMVEQKLVEARAEVSSVSAPKFSLLETALRGEFGVGLDNIKWAYDGSSFKLGSVECGHHGFRGANGSRGTVEGFAKFGVKMTIGDKHSPAILDGVYCAGAMKLQQGYNVGPSSWAIAHVVQYPNDKRSIVTFQKGKWRA